MDTFPLVVKQFYEMQTRQALHEISIDEILQTLWAHSAALQRLEEKFFKSSLLEANNKESFQEWILSELKAPSDPLKTSLK